jgi:hypothetical protein
VLKIWSYFTFYSFSLETQSLDSIKGWWGCGAWYITGTMGYVWVYAAATSLLIQF